jgi:hypothetical protein
VGLAAFHEIDAARDSDYHVVYTIVYNTGDENDRNPILNINFRTRCAEGIFHEGVIRW